MPLLPFVLDDGGRAEAGFRGDAGDCVTRAVAIATGRPYADIYREVAAINAARGRARSAREGMKTKDLRAYLKGEGFVWNPVMTIGGGCTMHLVAGELPRHDRMIVRLSGHVCAVVDGVIRDAYDPSRGGTRCVYGYWTGGEW